MTSRGEVVAEARTWLATPFHHHQCAKGAGVDCAHLVVGVCKALGLMARDFALPPYQMMPDGRQLLALADAYMDRTRHWDVGDVVIVTGGIRAQHVGIVGDYRYGGHSIIHACNARHCVPPRVIETRLMFSRDLRFVAAYRIRGVQ